MAVIPAAKQGIFFSVGSHVICFRLTFQHTQKVSDSTFRDLEQLVGLAEQHVIVINNFYPVAGFQSESIVARPVFYGNGRRIVIACHPSNREYDCTITSMVKNSIVSTSPTHYLIHSTREKWIPNRILLTHTLTIGNGERAAKRTSMRAVLQRSLSAWVAAGRCRVANSSCSWTKSTSLH